jgi:ribonuclease HII
MRLLLLATMKAPTKSKQVPTLEEEVALLSQGYSFIAGVDEAGRGSLAGPVVAAAVILPLLSPAQEKGWGHPTPRQGAAPLGTLLYPTKYQGDSGTDPALGQRIGMTDPLLHAPLGTPFHFDHDECMACFKGVRDSKQLTAREREQLFEVIMQHALAVGVGIGSVEMIDERNILQATKYAMRDALAQLTIPPQALLLDAIHLPDIDVLQRPIIKGDELCLSIAAASIIAKVTRDRIMIQLHEHYPAYGFAQHKGYGTENHLAALREHGATPHHRRSFAPVRELFGLFKEEELNSSRLVKPKWSE